MTTIIVGAGLAGLAAAQRLAEKGRAATVLEARDRIGGRAFTRMDDVLDSPVELGAEWYDRSGPVAALLDRAQAIATEATGKRVESKAHTLQILDNELEENGGLLRRVHLPEGEDVSLAAALEECCSDPEFHAARAMFSGYVEGLHAAHTDRVSVRWLREVEKKHPASSSDCRSTDGIHPAVEVLRSDLQAFTQIRLGTVVREIRWQRGRVEIQAGSSNDVFSATSAIVTVPLAVLKTTGDHNASLRFFPKLEEQQAAARLIETGHATKMVLRFRSPFWRENAHLKDALFLHAFDQPFPTWWTAQTPDMPLLTAWAGGPQSTRLGTTSTDALLELAITSLANALHTPRREVEGELTAHYHHDWNTDPFSLGAYTYVGVGGLDACKELARPVEDTLFFAGEATCGDGQNATMEGAIVSGWRAADEVLALP